MKPTPFNNYYQLVHPKIFIAGVLTIVTGFIIMATSASQSVNVFKPEIFGFWHITVAPVVVILGYIIVLLAILYSEKIEN